MVLAWSHGERKDYEAGSFRTLTVTADGKRSAH
jgi:hypothetical protein